MAKGGASPVKYGWESRGIITPGTSRRDCTAHIQRIQPAAVRSEARTARRTAPPFVDAARMTPPPSPPLPPPPDFRGMIKESFDLHPLSPPLVAGDGALGKEEQSPTTGLVRISVV